MNRLVLSLFAEFSLGLFAVTQFSTVYIWCKRFGVPLGSAKLTS